jgi:hypothetical protein
MEAAGIPVDGSPGDRLGRADIEVDCTPKGVDAKNKDRDTRRPRKGGGSPMIGRASADFVRRRHSMPHGGKEHGGTHSGPSTGAAEQRHQRAEQESEQPRG